VSSSPHGRDRMFVWRCSSHLALIVSIQSANRTPSTFAYRFSLALGIETRNFQRKALGITNMAGDDISDTSIEKKSASIDAQQLFGRFKISSNQIFLRTTHSFAMVNLRPIVSGHVLICSTCVTPLLSDLGDDEYDDLWRTVRKVQRVLKRQYKCDAFNVAVQDGSGAGQSVPHAHVHILPRYCGDFERNDDVYDELEAWAPRDENESKAKLKKIDVPEDSKRRDRTVGEMAAEAAMYQSLIPELFP
jgi:bis(5'-adenosyl)-triphosphatase